MAWGYFSSEFKAFLRVCASLFFLFLLQKFFFYFYSEMPFIKSLAGLPLGLLYDVKASLLLAFPFWFLGFVFKFVNFIFDDKDKSIFINNTDHPTLVLFNIYFVIAIGLFTLFGFDLIHFDKFETRIVFSKYNLSELISLFYLLFQSSSIFFILTLFLFYGSSFFILKNFVFTKTLFASNTPFIRKTFQLTTPVCLVLFLFMWLLPDPPQEIQNLEQQNTTLNLLKGTR